MAEHQNKLSRFWQELKRRRVIHVITVYASAAFVIIELIGNLTEPLNLPATLSTIVIIVLAVGFPLAIVLSWLYDLTSGSFERTKPIEDIQDEEKAKVPNAWKIATYVSFVVIAGLIVLNIASRGDLIKPGMINSMVVLPFDNYTGDENLDYVASGMHASLIGDIGKVSALRIIGTTTSNVIKSTEKSLPEIAKEWDVDLVMEPTLTCYGDTVCILVRAIMPFPKEKQVWVAEYREDKSKILSIWNRIAKQIADEVKVELTPEEKQLLSKSMIIDREAYDAYLKGSLYWDDLSSESLYKALDYLNLAVEKDPNWAPLYVGLAKVWGGIAQAGYEKSEVAGPKIFENIQKAMELDPDLPDLHHILAINAVWNEWDWEKGEQEFLKTLAVNPNDALSRAFYGHLLIILQRKVEALFQVKMAVELDPLNPFILALSAPVFNSAGDTQTALEYLEKALSLDPHHFFAINLVEPIAWQDGDYDRAFEAGKIMMKNEFLSSDKKFINEIEKTFEDQGFFAAYEALVKKLEIIAQNDYINPTDLAVRYSFLNNHQKAMDWIEIGFEQHDPNMPYIASGAFPFDSLYTNPRFMAILEKMELPIPETD